MPAVGGIYKLRHQRFGCAEVEITKIPDDTWVDVHVLKGELRGIGAGSRYGPGESRRVRMSHCTWTPLDTE